MDNLKCNGCEWAGDEDTLSLIEFNINDDLETPTAIEDFNGNVLRLAPEPEIVDFLKGCPNCNTDSYLTNLE